MTDIDAIRARNTMAFDAARAGIGQPTEAAFDIAALLAEVDRLTALVKPPRGQKSDWFDHGWAIGAASQKARIRAAVEGLTNPFHQTDGRAAFDGYEECRAAVLAAIEGETP